MPSYSCSSPPRRLPSFSSSIYCAPVSFSQLPGMLLESHLAEPASRCDRSCLASASDAALASEPDGIRRPWEHHIQVPESPAVLPVTTEYLVLTPRNLLTYQECKLSPRFGLPAALPNLSPALLCRICHDGETSEKLLSPCMCRGSVASVHRSCLERWLKTAQCGQCELCGFSFNLIKKPIPVSKLVCGEEYPEIRKMILGDMLCFLLLTPLTLLSLYLCVEGAINYSSKKTGFRKPKNMVLSIVPFIISEGKLESNKTEPLEDRPRVEEYWQVTGLIILSCLLMLIYISWISVAIRYQVASWRKWRRTYQEITLQET